MTTLEYGRRTYLTRGRPGARSTEAKRVSV